MERAATAAYKIHPVLSCTSILYFTNHYLYHTPTTTHTTIMGFDKERAYLSGEPGTTGREPFEDSYNSSSGATGNSSSGLTGNTHSGHHGHEHHQHGSSGLTGAVGGTDPAVGHQGHGHSGGYSGVGEHSSGQFGGIANVGGDHGNHGSHVRCRTYVRDDLADVRATTTPPRAELAPDDSLTRLATPRPTLRLARPTTPATRELLTASPRRRATSVATAT